MFDILKFNQDSLEFSTGNCTKDIPVKVELKPGKSIIFYPVFTDISKKRDHTYYSDISRNNKQIKMGFILLRNKSTDRNGEPPEFVRSGETYWSNPVSLDYRNNGYKIIPVNPKEKELMGAKCYPDLISIPEPIDVVDIFRRSEDVKPVVEEAVKIKAKTIWMQEGIINNEAAKIAKVAGLRVVMDKCMRKELMKLREEG